MRHEAPHRVGQRRGIHGAATRPRPRPRLRRCVPATVSHGEDGWSDVVVEVARSRLAPPIIIISSLSGSCAGASELVQGGVEENFGGVTTVLGRKLLLPVCQFKPIYHRIPPAPTRACHLLSTGTILEGASDRYTVMGSTVPPCMIAILGQSSSSIMGCGWFQALT